MKLKLREHFERIRSIIKERQKEALHTAYMQQLTVYWELGAYIHLRLESAQWGEKIVEQLAIWLKESKPFLKGFDRRSLYRMKKFYLTWQELDWVILKEEGRVVGLSSPQLPAIPPLLTRNSWTHHIEILKHTSSLEEKVFYLLLAIKDRYTVAELIRQFKTSLFERQKLSNQKIIEKLHPRAGSIPEIFRDKYIFEFLDLSEPHSENDIQKGLLFKLNQFVLELGKDFIFMSEEFRVQVGMYDYYIDLLFFHRELQCMVAFELKNTEFQPEYLGKLSFYLEALDRDIKKKHENPSIGVLLCKKQEEEAVIWKNTCLLYFQQHSKLPLPAGVDEPLHDFRYYRQLPVNSN